MNFFNRSTIRDFTKERYLALVKSYPRLGEEKTQMYIMLILTFLSLSFLGVFAINPTLTTIVELRKKLDDSEFVSKSLETKINNLSSLITQYEALSSSWPAVQRAVPNDPKNVMLLGQIQTIAKDSSVNIRDLQTFAVEILGTSNKKNKLPKEASFVFTVSAEGVKENILQFVKQLSSFDRVVAVESIEYSSSETESVTIRGRVFFNL